MNTAAKIGIGVGVAALVASGLALYDYEEKSKCAAADGTWNGLFKGCVCPQGTTMVNGVCKSTPSPVSTQQQNCQSSGGTWNSSANTCTCLSGYEPNSSGLCVKQQVTPTVPGQVDPSTVNVSWQTPTNAQTVQGTLSWGAVSGATSYQVALNGGSPETVQGTSVTIQTTPGSSVQIAISACV